MFEDGDYDHEKDGYIPEGPRSPDRVADAEALAIMNVRPWRSNGAQQSSSNSSVAAARDDNIDRLADPGSDAEALAKMNFRPWISKGAQQSSSNSSIAAARDDNIARLAGLGDDVDVFGRQSAVTRSPGPAQQKRVQIRHPEGAEAEAEGDVFNVLHAPYQKDRG